MGYVSKSWVLTDFAIKMVGCLLKTVQPMVSDIQIWIFGLIFKFGFMTLV